MSSTMRTALGRVARSYVLFVVLGLVVGLTLAPVAWDSTSSDGTVAVVPLAGTISGGSAADVSSMLQRARTDSSIDAVVVVANSGGGGASASEELYLQMKRTTAEMPVVASVDASAASGAYYAIAPTDYIYAKPSSIVGSVGVLSTAPTPVEPNDIVATTGPNKLSGGDQREFYYLLESLGEAFYNAVFESRGEALKLTRAELAQARIYGGAQAVQNGLADGIGGRQAAVERAAEMAGLENYDVEVLRPSGPSLFLSRGNYLAADVPEKRMISPDYLVDERSSTPTFLMVPASYLDFAEQNRTAESGVLAPESRGDDVLAPGRAAVTGTEVADA